MIDADKMKEVAEREIYKAAYKWGTVSGGTIEVEFADFSLEKV